MKLLKLLPDWKAILKHAWSVRFMVLAGLLSGIEAVLPYFAADMPRGLFALLTILVIVGAMVARLLIQRMDDDDL